MPHFAHPTAVVFSTPNAAKPRTNPDPTFGTMPLQRPAALTVASLLAKANVKFSSLTFEPLSGVLLPLLSLFSATVKQHCLYRIVNS